MPSTLFHAHCFQFKLNIPFFSDTPGLPGSPFSPFDPTSPLSPSRPDDPGAPGIPGIPGMPLAEHLVELCLYIKTKKVLSRLWPLYLPCTTYPIIKNVEPPVNFNTKNTMQ